MQYCEHAQERIDRLQESLLETSRNYQNRIAELEHMNSKYICTFGEWFMMTRYFNIQEFRCKDGDRLVVVEKELIERLAELRRQIGKPIHITSGFRTRTHNTAVGGATNSRHLDGSAADITAEGITPQQMAELAELVGFRGIGIYGSFTHVDTRPAKAYWRG